ncbi:MAG: PAS domain S-box protein [Pseudomonadota bacterium]
MSVDNKIRLAMLQAVLRHAADGIISIDEYHTLITYNNAAEHMFGYSTEEIRAGGIDMLMPERDRRHHSAHVKAYLHGGPRRIIGTGRRVCCQHKNGTTFRADLSISEARVEGRRVFTAIFRDLTARDALQAQVETLGADLAHSNQELQTILRYAPIGIVTMSGRGRIITVNRAVSGMTGYDTADLVGRNALRFVHTDEQRQMGASFERLIGDGHGYSSSIHRIRCFDGSYANARTYNAVLAVDDVAQPILICMLQDISAELARDEELKLQRERLAHMARLTQMGEMAAGLAHELNQPLAAIANFAAAGERLSRQPTTETETLVDVFARIRSQAERAGQIVRNTRQLTRGRETQKRSCEVTAIVDELLPLLKVDSRYSQISVTTECADDTWVYADAVQIEQVILNFFRNAVDAVRELAEERRQIVIRTLSDLPAVTLEVEDRGPGVSSSLAKTLFEPFVTDKLDGMGMGLSISKTIIDSHDGDIGVKPAKPQGAIFWFRLPRIDPPQRE